LSEAAQNTPNDPIHTERKLLIPNNWDAATLICKQGVTGSIPVTSTNIFLLFSQLLIWPLASFARFGNNWEQ
jgi:hypothetical protein